jgi:D-arabinose 1-dehydrogenase-like Zn-dependent alcohol dehydrogenase
MTLPSHYKQAAFKEAGAPLTIEEVELTLPNAGQVLVKVEACGVCFSDTAAQAHGVGGKLFVATSHNFIEARCFKLMALTS